MTTPQQSSPPAPQARWRHKKRGTTYTEIGRAKLQASDTGGMSDHQPMVVYRSDDGSLWVRPEDEFEDGRFERLPSAPQAVKELVERLNDYAALLNRYAIRAEETGYEEFIERAHKQRADAKDLSQAASFLASLQEDRDRLERERDDVRRWLAGTDIGSLPNDWTLSQIAEARWDDICKLRDQVRDTCARAEQAERERDQAKEAVAFQNKVLVRSIDAQNKEKARADKAERERDELIKMHDAARGNADTNYTRLQQAERDLAAERERGRDRWRDYKHLSDCSMTEQDDTELLEHALTEQSKHGRLILRRPVTINGIVYAPAIYGLRHLGPAPEILPDGQ